MLGLTNKYIAHHPSPVKTISDYNSGWKERNYNSKYVLSQKPDYIIFSTGEKPSSYAERALFTKPKFFKCYYVYPILVDSTGMPRNVYKRYSQENITLRENMDQKNKDYSPSFVNLYNSFLNKINHQEYRNNFEDIKFLFNELIKHSPSYFGEPYRFMATLYYNKGNDIEAMKYLNKCLEVDPLNLYARMIKYQISKNEHLRTIAKQQINFLKNYFPGVCSKYRFTSE
jgi:tetratricopeptide (TPR) repeat protein